MSDRFVKAAHTLVVSDIHLSDAQERLARRPLWKRYKQRDLFVDDCFGRFLSHMRGLIGPDSELILNGDIFDFDSVMSIPKRPEFPVRWLERLRGLAPEEEKSRFKLGAIIRDHPAFFQALRDWVLAGHRVVFVIGNHDIELHWDSVRSDLVRALDLPEEQRDSVRVCEWFYISNADTHIEHGNQFDPYCVCPNPIHPAIRWRGRMRIRVPFGNQAERYMLNGMGLFNPHVESSFIRPLLEYIRFFVRHIMRVQPLLGWSWFWGALATLIVSLREGFLPALQDPLRLEARVDDIARRANADPGTVRALRVMHVHPAIFSPWKIARELWLDRVILLGLLVFGSFQIFTVLNIFRLASPWWAVAIFVALLPLFVFYARSVRSDVDTTERILRERLPVTVDIARAERVVIGHTHREYHLRMPTYELMNTGTWSPAYEDVECTIPFGRKCFAWIRPSEADTREAELFEWNDPGFTLIPEKRDRPPATTVLARAGEKLRRATGLESP